LDGHLAETPLRRFHWRGSPNIWAGLGNSFHPVQSIEIQALLDAGEVTGSYLVSQIGETLNSVTWPVLPWEPDDLGLVGHENIPMLKCNSVFDLFAYLATLWALFKYWLVVSLFSFLWLCFLLNLFSHQLFKSFSGVETEILELWVNYVHCQIISMLAQELHWSSRLPIHILRRRKAILAACSPKWEINGRLAGKTFIYD
jgi:hypothetical protein